MGWLKCIWDACKYPVEIWNDFWLDRYFRDFHTEDGRDENFMSYLAERGMPRGLSESEKDERRSEIGMSDQKYHAGLIDIGTFVEEAKKIVKRPPAHSPVHEGEVGLSTD